MKVQPIKGGVKLTLSPEDLKAKCKVVGVCACGKPAQVTRFDSVKLTATHICIDCSKEKPAARRVLKGTSKRGVAFKAVERPKDHDCSEHPVPYEYHSDGRRYHGWECEVCRALLQTG